MTKTELLLEYAKITWDIDLPDAIEQVLENDYVINSHLYSADVFLQVKLMLIICPDIEPVEVIKYVHSLRLI